MAVREPRDGDDETSARVERLEELARTSFDPGGTPGDRSFDPGALNDGLAGIAAVYRSEEELEDHRLLSAETQRVCIEGDLWQAWWRTWTSNGDCLPSGGCREARSNDDMRRVDVNASWWLSTETRWRRIDLGDDREAILARTTLRSPAASDAPDDALTRLDQLAIWVPDAAEDGQTWRISATWSAPTIDGVQSGPGRFAQDMHDGFAQTDQWLTGHTTCAWSRDDAPPPP